ncbi:MAG: hypothetical protein IEMM0008_1205 [bacterium]|nr:MAG: hypothetical protein IEMM0008_1205 [bacterium]
MQIKIGPIQSLSIIDALTLLHRVEEATKAKSFYHIVLLDLALFVRSLFNKELRRVINEADLVLPKGSFFLWGISKVVPCKDKIQAPIQDNLQSENLNDAPFDLDDEGIYRSDEAFQDHSNLSLLLFKYFENRPVGFFLLGDTLDNVHLAARYIKRSFPALQIMGTHSSKQLKRRPKELLEKLRKVAPHILILDFSRRKQEKWIRDHKDYLSSTVCIGMDREMSLYAGQQKGLKNGIALLVKGRWLFIFQACYYLLLIVLYKTLLKKEVQCTE